MHSAWSLKKNPVTTYIRNNLGILIGLVLMCAGIAAVEPRFLQSRNLLNIVRSISITGILGFGMTLCIIINGIDLSQGSVVGLTACFCAWMITDLGMSFGLAIIVSLLVGLLCGLFNGYFLANTSLPPFVVTLSMQLIARGFCYVITRGNMINIDARFGQLGNGYTFTYIPTPSSTCSSSSRSWRCCSARRALAGTCTQSAATRRPPASRASICARSPGSCMRCRASWRAFAG